LDNSRKVDINRNRDSGTWTYSSAAQDRRKPLNAKDFLARAGALIASRGIQDGLQALLLLWLARTDQSGYGLFVFGAGIAAMVQTGLSLGLDQFTLREFSADQQPRGPILGRMLQIKSSLGVLIVVGLIGFAFMKGWNSLQTAVVMVIVAGQIMEGLADTFFNLFRAEGRQVREGLYRAVPNLIGAAYGAACLLLDLGLIAFAFFLVLSNGLKLIAATTGALRMGVSAAWTRIHSFLLGGHIRAILTIAGVSLMGSFYNSIQIFLLKQFHGLSDVAFYGAASDLAGGISGLVAHLIIGAVLFPSLAEAVEKSPRELAERVRTYFWQLATYGVGLAFFLSTLGGTLLTTLYGPNYVQSVVPLRILGPAALLSFINNFGIYVLLAKREERRLLIYHLFPVSLSIGLGMVLIPNFGPFGAAVNLLVARTAMFILILAWMQKRLRPVRWFESLTILKASLSMGMVYLVLVWLNPIAAGVGGLMIYGVFVWKGADYGGGADRRIVPGK
jgi:O-antigen/teichoic acid export membrane protein